MNITSVIDSLPQITLYKVPQKGFSPNDTSQIKQINLMLDFHYSALHDVAKIENKNHKNPYPLKIRRHSKTEGLFLYRHFELCVNVHGRLKNCEYRNAYEWFFDLNKEVINGKILQIKNPFDFEKVHLYNVFDEFTSYLREDRKDHKRYLLSILRKQLTHIQKYKNPFTSEEMPVLSDLIQYSIELSEQNNDFRRKYLLPYIKAGRDLIREFDNEIYQAVTVQKPSKIAGMK